MSAKEIFKSVLRSIGDCAGVYEYDGDTGYFYLYHCKAGQGQKVAGAIRIVAGEPDFHRSDLAIRWEPAGNLVGLFIRGQLWAVFDSETNAKYGGDYRRGERAVIPEAIRKVFERA